MKKLITIILILSLLLPATSLADLPDISSLSYNELLQLREQVDTAIRNSKENKEIELHQGLWTVGEDFPAGTWLVTPIDNICLSFWYGCFLNDNWVTSYDGLLFTTKDENGEWEFPNKPHSIVLIMKEGWYIKTSGTIFLTPALNN